MYLGGAIVPMYKLGGGIVHTLCKVLNHRTTSCAVVKYLGGAKGNFCPYVLCMKRNFFEF